MTRMRMKERVEEKVKRREERQMRGSVSISMMLEEIQRKAE
jgi:hypothetical protein